MKNPTIASIILESSKFLIVFKVQNFVGVTHQQILTADYLLVGGKTNIGWKLIVTYVSDKAQSCL